MDYKKWILKLLKNEGNYNTLLEKLKTDKLTDITGINGSALSLNCINLYDDLDRSIVFIAKDDDDAKVIYEDMISIDDKNTFYFPSLNLSPYQNSVVNEDITAVRLEVIKQLINNKKIKLITSLDAVIHTITPMIEIVKYYKEITVGDKLSVEELTDFLVFSGYNRVKQVADPGEFAVRGDIVDIFYSSLKSPIRIDFFDRDVEVIKSFDPETQKSEDKLSEVTIPPVKEILYSREQLDGAAVNVERLCGDDDVKNEIISKINNFTPFDGEYFYLRAFYEKCSIIDYLDNPILVLSDKNLLEKTYNDIYTEYLNNYGASYNVNRPKYEIDQIIYSVAEIAEKQVTILQSNMINKSVDTMIDYGLKGIPVYLGNIDLFKKDVRRFLNEKNTVVINAFNNVQAERLIAVFNDFAPYTQNSFTESALNIVPYRISDGFVCENGKAVVLNDYEIFGKKNKISRHYYNKRTEQIDSFIDLAPGDYVVHIHHGVGKFMGIERIKSLDTEKDYISILYADNDKVFIPIEQMNFVQKYISGGIDSPALDKIGAKGWSRTKEKVKESVNKLARELVKLYSYRLNQKGFAFSPDTPWQKEFEARFPYEETEDQILSIEEVKRDMESLRPMDRLICGDVGFGKTEVAIRAAFKAVMSGKQVVILVPTTILAEQHYETFSERISSYPIKVEMLSRFREPAEQKKIIYDLNNGDVDIIIGTHRLLSDDIKYKNPGLLIIDEEHRFGVKHKEKIKQLKMNLDVLSMTATPIPRTLHMSLSKIRDMSVINTPPKERLPIETYVMEFNEDTIIRGIKHELERGGQVFFLYNRIKTIFEMEKFIKNLVPEARTIVAHGQMDPDELEDIIHSFINYKYDVLITTTIIETGIDIPRVNTIFIDKADKFGLAQLYQLRGRVGRSNVKAYAYLFHDESKVLTEDAMKRLRVISEHTDLGSGFKVAMKDLEIRGAGNMLGSEQHGDILAVGFSLYCKLLTEAVRELKKESDNPEMFDEIAGEDDVYLDIEYKGYIPDSYISDTKQKMEIYKKIAQIHDENDLLKLRGILEDRYGKIPFEVEKLLYIGELRILCRKLNIVEMTEKSHTIQVRFNSPDKLDIMKLMKAVTVSAGNIFLKSDKPDSVFIKIPEDLDIETKGGYIKGVLANFT